MRITNTKKVAVGAMSFALMFGGVACSDEDGDGAGTDEEVDQVDESVDSLVDEADDEMDEADETVDSMVDEAEQEMDEADETMDSMVDEADDEMDQGASAIDDEG